MMDFNDADPHFERTLIGDHSGVPVYDRDQIIARLQETASFWVLDLFPNGRIAKDRRAIRLADLYGRAPSGEGSAEIKLAGEYAGFGYDFADADSANPIDLISRATGLHGHELMARAAEIAGVSSSPMKIAKAPREKPYDEKKSIANILERAAPIAGTKTEAYLQARGLKARPGEDLLHCEGVYHRNTGQYFPAMIARIRGGAGEFMDAIHRTFIDRERPAKADVSSPKKMLGSVIGGSVRLFPLGPDGRLGVAEGIETAIAAAEISYIPVWAALSANGMRQWQWPAEVREITIFSDAGQDGESAADELHERITAQGLNCRIIKPLHGDDFADDLIQGATWQDYAQAEPEPRGWDYADFFGYLPTGRFLCRDTRDLWPTSSVNAQLPWKGMGKAKVSPASWLLRHQAIQQMTWAPGRAELIENMVISEGGFIERQGNRIFNLFRPAIVKFGKSDKALPWIDHIESIYPGEASELIAWFAHRAQRPGEKINHAIVLGGSPGIGKDTILEPVKYAIGAWNFIEVSPKQLLGRFNGYIKSVILRISESRDLGEIDRYAFYDHCKTLTASPPDVLRCDEKNAREYSVLNVCGVIQTTNYKTNGLYLPADDRRNFVAWSEVGAAQFDETYWTTLYGWYGRGGLRHVAAYLAEYDLADFNPKKPPRKTEAFWDIADAHRAPEDSELADVLDVLGHPKAITLARIIDIAPADLADWLRDRKNRRKIPHRMESAGYAPVRNKSDKRDGQWKIQGKRQTVYAKEELSVKERIEAARSYVDFENR